MKYTGNHLSNLTHLLKIPLRRILLLQLIHNILIWDAAGNIGKIDWRDIEYSDTLDVLLNNRLVGILKESLRMDESAGKVVLSNSMTTESDARGNIVTIHEKRVYNANGDFIQADQRIKSPAGVDFWNLKKDSGGIWVLAVTAGGVTTRKKIGKISENLGSTYEIYKGIRFSKLKAGIVLSENTLDLTSAQQYPVTTICKETPSKQNGNKWIFVSKNGISDRDERWEVDLNGRTLYREEYPFIARRHISDSQNILPDADLFDSFKIPMDRGAATNEKICLSGNSSFHMDPSVDGFYLKKDDFYILLSQDSVCRLAQKLTDDSLKQYTSATVTMQSDNNEIITIAKRLSSRVSDRCEIVRTFNRYVYTTLKKQNTVTFSSAIETLHAGFGDCGEHSVFLAALLRAAGIPSRVVLGLIYVDSKHAYFYHAWVMAYIEHWIFVDPAFGIFPANRDRIPLMIDDTGEKSISLSKSIGRIKIRYTK